MNVTGIHIHIYLAAEVCYHKLVFTVMNEFNHYPRPLTIQELFTADWRAVNAVRLTTNG
jgi:hypothetical protein